MNPQAAPVERRQNLRLRAIFDEAYDRIVPFLDPGRFWSGSPMTALAYRAIRGAYPDLSPAEAYTIIVAAVRVYNTRGNRAPANAAKSARPEPA